jgi:myo-inositol-1(or 4)-monophosphatase
MTDRDMPADPLDPRHLETARRFAVGALEDAGRGVLVHFRGGVAAEDKSAPDADFDPVTIADREAEAELRAAIAARWPGHGILGEESGTEAGTGRCGWTIDPIDGTRGFIAGFAHWGMLLAHTVDGRPRVGAVHQPWIGETFSGGPEGARFRRTIGDDGRERALRTRPCPDLSSAIAATTDPYLFEGDEARAFEALRTRVRLVRYGADCYAYCLLAGGHLDLVVESGLGPWDVQALIPIVEAAGGVVTDWRGGDCSGGGRVLAAGDARLHAAALERLASIPEGA